MSQRTYSRREALRTLASGIAGGLLLNAGVGTALARSAFAFGDGARLHLALLHYPSDAWNLRPHALGALLREVNQTTSILTAEHSDTVALNGDFSSLPLIFVAGDGEFSPWSDRARSHLRRYIGAGGMLVFDSSEAQENGGFRQSVERELAQILPGKTLQRTSSHHVLYKSFYLCKGNEGRTTVADHTDSIQGGGRIQALYSFNDLLGAYARGANGANQFAVTGGDRRRDWAFRLGVNIVMYAMCLKYKADQVHVPFILRRRQWSVP